MALQSRAFQDAGRNTLLQFKDRDDLLNETLRYLPAQLDRFAYQFFEVIGQFL